MAQSTMSPSEVPATGHAIARPVELVSVKQLPGRFVRVTGSKALPVRCLSRDPKIVASAQLAPPGVDGLLMPCRNHAGNVSN